ncbi:MAG TPA: sensor domain-containing protein [Actinomycetes bacterium]|jgi:signal transduction histidine kinase|nr:sensor domain-containing protein [Actinomycetes bacterium]
MTATTLPEGPPPAAIARAAVRGPFTRRAWMELAYCLVGIPLGVAGFAAVAALLYAGALLTAVLVGLLVVVGALAAARGLGGLHRRLADRLLGDRVAAPAPPRPGRGPLGWLGARLRDAAGWRAVAYVLLKLPVSILGAYAAGLWVGGLVNMSYPLWWLGFRNHPPGTRLSPVPVVTLLPMGRVPVATYPGTFLALAIGAATVLVAPWLTRAVVELDRRLVRTLLGPGALAERVRDLEETRALAVDEEAATLRRLERDLHDGTQARLVALAMSLGMVKEKLGEGGGPLDPDRARELVDSAHRNATEAIAELRDLARGIHPPVLDGGLADALTTLAARSSVPVALEVDVPVRPTAAIETIAYFCAAELLANVARHSGARRATVEVTQRDRRLRLRVTDDGRGGARPGAGSGLAGLSQRVRTVDGSLAISSPEGGPTVVTVELPLHA